MNSIKITALLISNRSDSMKKLSEHVKTKTGNEFDFTEFSNAILRSDAHESIKRDHYRIRAQLQAGNVDRDLARMVAGDIVMTAGIEL